MLNSGQIDDCEAVAHPVHGEAHVAKRLRVTTGVEELLKESAVMSTIPATTWRMSSQNHVHHVKPRRKLAQRSDGGSLDILLVGLRGVVLGYGRCDLLGTRRFDGRHRHPRGGKAAGAWCRRGGVQGHCAATGCRLAWPLPALCADLPERSAQIIHVSTERDVPTRCALSATNSAVPRDSKARYTGSMLQMISSDARGNAGVARTHLTRGGESPLCPRAVGPRSGLRFSTTKTLSSNPVGLKTASLPTRSQSGRSAG